MTRIERIVHHCNRLPAMPAVVSKLNALAQNERSSASDFERVIKPDVTLAATLLRLANSPAFGFASRITDVRTAVTLLGMKRVCELATSAHLLRVVSDRLHGYEMEAASFWTHCSAVAILSEALAKDLNTEFREHAFTCGLLHDIGKLAISCAWREDPAVFKTPDAIDNFFDAEREALGTDHAEVGGTLAEKWHLPPAVDLAIRWHHQPMGYTGPNGWSCVAVVHVANVMAHALGYGADAGGLRRRLDPAVCDKLGVRSELLEKIASQTADMILSAAEAYENRGKFGR